MSNRFRQVVFFLLEYQFHVNLHYFFFPFSGAIIFGSDQEVREVMRAVRRNNATGAFSWIGSDGWSARNLVSDGNEPEVMANRKKSHLFHLHQKCLLVIL